MLLLQRLLGAVLAVLLFVVALLAASVAFAVIVALGLAAWIWLSWRGRSVARRRTIEGEFQDVTHLERLEERRGERL